jgi:hypothetical protein
LGGGHARARAGGAGGALHEDLSAVVEHQPSHVHVHAHAQGGEEIKGEMIAEGAEVGDSEKLTLLALENQMLKRRLVESETELERLRCVCVCVVLFLRLRVSHLRPPSLSTPPLSFILSLAPFTYALSLPED